MATTILGLPELEAAQGQKYLTVNQALQRLDALVNLTVFNRTQTAPPGSPSAGHRYIVAATATGAFTGQEGNIAVYIGTNWIFFTPSEGWRAYDQGANQFIIWNGSAWVLAGLSSSALRDDSVTLLGVGATPDTTNRLSVTSPGVLFNRETDDLSVTMNKQSAGDDLQLILQTGFSTRGIIGLIGNDNLAIRVSADGSSFFNALTFTAGSGIATFNDRVRTGDGSAATPAWSFGSNSDNGFYRIGTNSVGLSIGGTLRLTCATTAFTFASSIVTLSATAANITANYLGLGGATADATNRLSVNTPAVLLNHAGAGIDMTFNKNAAGNDASLSFKTGFSTKALLGLLGDDNFTIKVGGSFLTTMYSDATTGQARFPNTIRIEGVASDPVSPVNGDLWYNSAGNRLKARIDGVTSILGLAEFPYLKPNAGRYFRASTTPGTSTITVAGVANRMSAYPFIPKFDFTCDRMGINVTTAVAASNAKIAIYDSDTDGRPNQRLTETGDLNCSTIGAKESTISVGFKEGKQYWIVVRTSSTQTLSAFQPYTTPDLDATAIATTQFKTLNQTLAYATSAPATWTYSATDATTVNAAVVWFRMS